VPLLIPFPNIDPVLVEIGPIAIRWYALAYIFGLVLGWRYVVRLCRRPEIWPGGKAPMTPQQPEALLTWMAIGVILGGRLGFVLFYRPEYYLANPSEILMVWTGGMSFHGGFLGVIVGVILWSRAVKAPMLQVGDAVACAAPIGLLFGRIANFINGELWGRPTDVAWAMIFPDHRGGGLPRHPSQLYEAALEGLVLFLVMWWGATRLGWLKRPGALIGVFFIGYGLARSFIENFRQGDDFYVTETNPYGHFIRFGETADAMGLTMGQILSLPMVAIGVGFLLWSRRSLRPTAA
jgi:phosphatidylglycerol:prolipoprotein diacylglycerol transferase